MAVSRRHGIICPLSECEPQAKQKQGGIETVSYTHLAAFSYQNKPTAGSRGPVKGQLFCAQRLYGAQARRLARGVNAEENADGDGKQRDINYSGAVSYTHLDVYKRQLEY